MRRSNRRVARRLTHFERFEERLALSAQGLTDVPLGQQIQAPSVDLFQEVAPSLNDAHNQTGLTTVRNQFGFNGAGQTVAVIDTGIAWDHLNLGGGYGAGMRVVGGYDFAENDADPYDDPSGYHGTHVAGIIASDHSTYSGVAPGVDLVGLRVFDDSGNGVFSWVESALQWVHDHRNDYANPITTVNLSLGASWNADTVPSWAMLEDEFAQLEADGVFIAVAAGNSFTDYNSPGLSYPAASSYVVPVASVGSDGNLSYFSQRNSRVLAAPGEQIASTVPDHLFGSDGNPTDVASASGTSMAAPYVAGASVLVREAMEFVGQSNITQDDIYDVLYHTADIIYDTATAANYHSINLEAAFAALMPSDDFGSIAVDAHDLGTTSSLAQTDGIVGTLNDVDFFTFTADTTGQMSISVDQTHALDANLILVGGNGQWNDGTFSFDVAAGQDYTFSIDTNVGIGRYTLSYDLQATAIDLGTIDQQIVTNQQVNNTLYQVTAQQSGIFTIEAMFVNANGNVDLIARDMGGNLLGSSTGTTDLERLDVTVTAGTVFTVEALGNNQAVTLRLTNLVEQVSNGFLVSGTGNGDNVIVDVGQRTIVINDVSYTASSASAFATVVINAGTGTDSLTVIGSNAAEAASLSTNEITMTSTGFSLSATAFANVTMVGGANDVANLFDTVENEQFTATPTSAQLTGSSFQFTVNSFGQVIAHASTGNDIATFYDSNQDDRFESGWDYAELSSTEAGYANRAEGFDSVFAYSQNGGIDLAYFYDSSGNDRFYATENYGLMRGPNDNFYIYAEGFDGNYAFSQNGGTDYAYFYDSSGNDRFYSTETYGLMRGPNDNFYNYAEGFDGNYAFSQNGGADYAYFYDSSGNDRFYSTENYGLMRGPNDNFYNYAEGFDGNYAFSQNGGADYAFFYDSSGNDRFYATATYGLMRGPNDNFYNYAQGFTGNYAFAQNGGFDMAYFYDSSGDDRFYATPDYGLMRGPSDNFYNYANGFDRNYAFAQNGGFDMAYFYDSAGNDLFYATGTYGLLRDVNTTFYNYSESFERLYAISTNGGTDNAYFYDSAGNDRYYYTNSYSLFRGENSEFYHFAQGFSNVDVHSENGGTDEAFIYDIDSDDSVAGTGDWFQLTHQTGNARLSGFYRIVAESQDDESPTSEVQAVDYIFEQVGDWH
ncbi:MAG: S8 family serine peptidase [Pirellulaceae bacterium]